MVYNLSLCHYGKQLVFPKECMDQIRTLLYTIYSPPPECSIIQENKMSMLVSTFVLAFTLTGVLYAAPCADDGPVLLCNVTSDSNGNGSLESVAAALQKKVVRIDINISFLHLARNIKFTNFASLVINGDPKLGTTINCTNLDLIVGRKGAGITFNNIRNLTLNNLTVGHCGSTFILRERNFSSALTMDYCKDVFIRNVVITKSHGIALTITHHRGNLSIVRSNFTDNIMTEEAVQESVYGGGGIYFVKILGKFQLNYYEFVHCTFANNIARTRGYFSFYTNEFGEDQSGYGRGGGVFIEFNNITQHLQYIVSFSYCTFRNNQAFLGGGLSVQIGTKRYERLHATIKVLVKNSAFDSNGCENVANTKIGGGANIMYNSFNTFKTTGNEYIFQSVIFSKNCAEIGGGVLFQSHIWQNISKNSLLFDNCTFNRNRAHIGSAIDMTPNFNARLKTGYSDITPTFRNCRFTRNSVHINSALHDVDKIAGSGTLYASLYDIRFDGYNKFSFNNGTPIYIVNGIVNFTNSNVTFENNMGIRGGAIALIGTSSIIVGPSKKYLFINNTAHYQGGAIYAQMIETHDFTVSKSCFLSYMNGTKYISKTPWDNNIIFLGNKAALGSAIFVTSLHACQSIVINGMNEFLNTSDVFSSRGINIDDTEVATEGAQFQREYTTLYTIPGKQYSHGVTIMDDTRKKVDEPLRASLKSNDVMLDPAYSSYVRGNIQLRGKPGARANITLQTVSTRQSYTTFEVELEECPPGFNLEIDRCVCNANEYFGLLDYCDNDNFQTFLTPGIWVGVINDSEMVTSICPNSFCDYVQSRKNGQSNTLGIVLPTKGSDLDDMICGKSRTGVLCGSCRPGFTVHFHSPKYLCKPTNPNLCKVGWIFYILSELVPVTVVFITVIVLNISFTSGAVNGFILFSQILLSLNIDASGVITFPNKRAITEGYQFLYGFLNLDFFTIDSLSFCLWPNATALDMIAFKYITIVYALSLVILVIWFMNKCGGRCLGKYCRITTVKSSVIHGISAFLIICYSHSVLVSHSLVNGAELWLKEGSNTTIPRRVWLDGNMLYFSRSHLPYALPALLCLLTIGVVPPLLLLAYPLLNKLLTVIGFEESKVVRCISQRLPVSSLKPLLDCFQGCFKDNLRFFAGLYFLYRWIAPVVYTMTSSLGTSYILTETFLILILAVHSFSHPYIKTAHNMLDTVLFTDLLLINSITCINYFLFQSQESHYTVNKSIAITSIIQAMLIYLPFIAMIAYLLLLGNKHMCYHWCKMQRKFGLRPLESTNNNYNEQELPHRLFINDFNYHKFEDNDNNCETY